MKEKVCSTGMNVTSTVCPRPIVDEAQYVPGDDAAELYHKGALKEQSEVYQTYSLGTLLEFPQRCTISLPVCGLYCMKR